MNNGTKAKIEKLRSEIKENGVAVKVIGNVVVRQDDDGKLLEQLAELRGPHEALIFLQGYLAGIEAE